MATLKMYNRATSSGYKGVYKREHKVKAPTYRAQFSINYAGKEIKIAIGEYSSAEEAHKRRIEFIDSLK